MDTHFPSRFHPPSPFKELEVAAARATFPANAKGEEVVSPLPLREVEAEELETPFPSRDLAKI